MEPFALDDEQPSSYKKGDVIYIIFKGDDKSDCVEKVQILTNPHCYIHSGEKYMAFRGLLNRKENDYTVRERNIL